MIWFGGTQTMGLNEAMKMALEQMKEIVLFFAADGKIIYANVSAREQLEYGQEIYEHTVADVFPGEFSDSTEMTSHIAKLSATGNTLDAYRSNRTCFQVEAKFLKLEENIFSCMAYDATEQAFLQRRIEQVQQEAQAAAKVKSEFVANITHELRTPVNGILGNVLELKEIEDDPAKCKVLSLVERGCADMNAIINNILDFSKLEAGKFTIEKREFVFRDMMEYVESNHRPKAVEKGLELSVSISPDIPERVIGDELRIVQVLNNLLSNACKFTSVGRVAVEVIKTTQLSDKMELFFLIIDTGIGIKKEDQDKLFQSFSQVDASISRKFGGTGLGLNICKQLVELMDGSIHVESIVGQGSMFSFHIWVDLPEDYQTKEVDEGVPGAYTMGSYQPTLADFTVDSGVEQIRTYGTEENISEITRNISKLILSVEMENWEKAEGFANVLRDLTENAPREVKNLVLRMKMGVQKEDYDKAADAVEKLRDLLEE